MKRFNTLINNSNFMPIREVNVNRQVITIKGRIVQKSATLQTLKSGLRFFHIDIIDRDNDVIRIKFWRQRAEEYYEILDLGSVYVFKCTGNDVVVSNSKFNDTSNPYEINFSDRCLLRKIEDDDESISKVPKCTFSTIEEIKNMHLPSIINIIGIVKQFGSCTKVISRKNNDEVSRRTITLVDQTKYQINITLWGDLAEVCEERLSGNPVVILKGIQIRDYQGRQGSTLNGRSTMDFSQDCKMSEEMKIWYDKNANNAKFESISNVVLNELSNGFVANERVSLQATLKDVRLRMDSEIFSAQSFQVLARVSKIGSVNTAQQVTGDKNTSLTYDACPNCKKKVMIASSFCEKCDEPVIPDTKYLFPVTIEDHTCSLTVRCFHEIGSIFIREVSSSACKEMEQSNNKRLNFVLNFLCLWRYYNLRIQLKTEEYNNQKKTQAILQSAEPVDLEQVAGKMLLSINQSLSCSQNKRHIFEDSGDTNKRVFIR
ncbi:replication factor-a protein [Cryptosporidium felis]|nr:replication factor-a protein [Cryptosporidium felis]